MSEVITAPGADMAKFRRLQTLIDLYRDMSAQAFKWAEYRRRDPLELFPHAETLERAAEYMQRYMEGLPGTAYGAQFPGRATHLIDCAFADMGQNADRWEEWGNKLAAVHDRLVALSQKPTFQNETQ